MNDLLGKRAMELMWTDAKLTLPEAKIWLNKYYGPEEIFSMESLANWALNNGFIHTVTIEGEEQDER